MAGGERDMRRAANILLLVILCFTYFTGCSTGNKSGEGSEIQSSSQLRAAEDYFKSIKELKDRSLDMVEVSVVSDESYVYNALEVTVSTVEIKSSLKGNFQPGQQIRIIETSFGAMALSEQYFLFIKEYEGEAATDAYRVLGSFTGKFKIDKDYVIQNAPDEYKIKDYAIKSKAKFIELVMENWVLTKITERVGYGYILVKSILRS